MTFKLGLTGSIGMGKSTTAKLFVEEGCALWDADAAVHRLYSKGGAAVDPIARLFPSAIENGSVSREKLKQIIGQIPDALQQIEEIVHPLVAKDRQAFIEQAKADVVVFDIPLLFENGTDALMDATVCVTAPEDVQKERVMARGTMSEAQFEAIRSKQMSDHEKTAKADFVIETDTLEHARAQVHDIMKIIRDRIAHA